jgi:DNA-binding transcriptional ArsR family regulator
VPIVSILVNKQQQVSQVFGALADPTRRRIVERLSRAGEVRVTTLAVPFRISLPAFSRHLRVLERAKLIQRRRNGRLHLIRSRPDGASLARRWMDHYIGGWKYSFDALERLLKKDEA